MLRLTNTTKKIDYLGRIFKIPGSFKLADVVHISTQSTSERHLAAFRVGFYDYRNQHEMSLLVLVTEYVGILWLDYVCNQIKCGNVYFTVSEYQN